MTAKQEMALRIVASLWLTYAAAPILAMPVWLVGKALRIPVAIHLAEILLTVWIIGAIAFWIACLMFGKLINRR